MREARGARTVQASEDRRSSVAPGEDEDGDDGNVDRVERQNEYAPDEVPDDAIYLLLQEVSERQSCN